MTRARRKIRGALLQILGGTVALLTFATGFGFGHAAALDAQITLFIVAFVIMFLLISGGVACIWWGSAMFQNAQRGSCPRCEYDLHGQVEMGCPECGWMRGG